MATCRLEAIDGFVTTTRIVLLLVITPDGVTTQYAYDFEGNRVRPGPQFHDYNDISSTYIGQIYEVKRPTTIQYITAGPCE